MDTIGRVCERESVVAGDPSRDARNRAVRARLGNGLDNRIIIKSFRVKEALLSRQGFVCLTTAEDGPWTLMVAPELSRRRVKRLLSQIMRTFGS